MNTALHNMQQHRAPTLNPHLLAAQMTQHAWITGEDGSVFLDLPEI